MEGVYIRNEAAGDNPATIAGTVMRYGDSSVRNGVREVYMPGSMMNVNDGSITVTVQHMRDRILGRNRRNARLMDSETSLDIELDIPATTEGADVLTGVREGLYTGWSLEGLIKQARMNAAGIREITAIELSAVSIVDNPQYRQSRLSPMRREAARVPVWMF